MSIGIWIAIYIVITTSFVLGFILGGIYELKIWEMKFNELAEKIDFVRGDNE